MGDGSGTSVVGDPHCIGFGGERYDFMGEHGKYYSMLSTGTLQVNARMLAVPLSDFTFIDHVGIKIGCRESGCVHIGVAIGSDAPIATLEDYIATESPVYFDTGLRCGSGTAAMGSLVVEKKTIKVDAGNFTIRIVQRDHDEETNTDIPHLNLFFEVGELGLLSDGVTPHGVIGQTANKDRVKPQGLLGKGIPEGVYRLNRAEGDVFISHQGIGVVEGTYSDYEVSDPFGIDCRFNRFGTEPTVEPVRSHLSGHIVALL